MTMNQGFSIKMPSHLYYDKTEGLCGSCNGDSMDDMAAPDGHIPVDADEFVKSWKTNEPGNLRWDAIARRTRGYKMWYTCFRIRTMRNRRYRRERNERHVFRSKPGRQPLSQVDGLENIWPMPRNGRREFVHEKMSFDTVPGSRRIVLSLVRSVRSRMSVVRRVFGLEITELVPVFLSER